MYQTVTKIKNASLKRLQAHVNAMDAEGWELVSTSETGRSGLLLFWRGEATKHLLTPPDAPARDAVIDDD